PGGDLIVLAPVSAGSELLADGHIHVYGPLRGRALAGVRGDTGARIFCQSLQAERVSVAGQYKVAAELRRQPLGKAASQIALEGDSLKITTLWQILFSHPETPECRGLAQCYRARPVSSNGAQSQHFVRPIKHSKISQEGHFGKDPSHYLRQGGRWQNHYQRCHRYRARSAWIQDGHHRLRCGAA